MDIVNVHFYFHSYAAKGVPSSEDELLVVCSWESGALVPNTCLKVGLAGTLLSHSWPPGGGCLRVSDDGIIYFPETSCEDVQW